MDANKNNDIENTRTEKAPDALLSDGIPPGLSMEEALTPGVVKLFTKDIKDKGDRMKLLEDRIDTLQDEKLIRERKLAVLETEDRYKTIREILLALVGISGGGTISFLNQPPIFIVFGVSTLILLCTYLFLKINKN